MFVAKKQRRRREPPVERPRSLAPMVADGGYAVRLSMLDGAALPSVGVPSLHQTLAATPKGFTFPLTGPRRVAGGGFLSGLTHSGRAVSTFSAQRRSTVFACLRFLMHMTSLPQWTTKRRRDDGGSDPARLPLDAILSRRACREFSAAQLRKHLVHSSILHGNGYAEIQFNNGGDVIGLWPLHPTRVRVDRNRAGRLIYRVTTDDRGEVILSEERMFHLRGFGDDVVGKSIISYAAEAIGWSEAIEVFGARFFRNNLSLGGYIIAPDGITLSADGKDALEAEIVERHQGAEKAYLPMILDVGMKYEKETTTPNEGQMVEAADHADRIICRFFGVPPSVVGIADSKQQFQDIEHQRIATTTQALMPIFRDLELEADQKLVQEQDVYTRIHNDELMRGDAKSWAEVLTTYTDKGVLNINEARAELDRNPVEGGNVHRVQQQWYPIDAPHPGAGPVKTPPQREDETT